MEHKCPIYVHISTLYSRTTSMDRQSTVIGFRKPCCVLVHYKSAAVGSVFEYAANSAVGERLRRGGCGGETSRSRGETGDIILLDEI